MTKIPTVTPPPMGTATVTTAAISSAAVAVGPQGNAQRMQELLQGLIASARTAQGAVEVHAQAVEQLTCERDTYRHESATLRTRLTEMREGMTLFSTRLEAGAPDHAGHVAHVVENLAHVVAPYAAMLGDDSPLAIGVREATTMLGGVVEYLNLVAADARALGTVHEVPEGRQAAVASVLVAAVNDTLVPPVLAVPQEQTEEAAEVKGKVEEVVVPTPPVEGSQPWHAVSPRTAHGEFNGRLYKLFEKRLQWGDPTFSHKPEYVVFYSDVLGVLDRGLGRAVITRSQALNTAFDALKNGVQARKASDRFGTKEETAALTEFMRHYRWLLDKE